jgi:protein O-GlcNAc transferase
MAPMLAEAISLWNRRQEQAAELACTAVLATAADDVAARQLLAQICSATGRHAEAASHHRLVVGLLPEDAAAHRRLGDALFAAGALEEAATSFRVAIELQPQNARAYNNLGRALAALGSSQAAAKAYAAAIGLYPGYAIAHTNLGIELAARNELPQALAHFDQAIASSPRLAEPYTHRARALLRLNRPQEALAALDRAVAIDAADPAIHRCRADALLRLQRPEEALSSLEAALAIDPMSADTFADHALVLYGLRRHEASLASCDRALALKADHLRALGQKAMTLHDMARFDEALAVCDRIVSLSDRSSTGRLLLRGAILKELRRFEEAATCYARLRELDAALDNVDGYLLIMRRSTCDWSQESLAADILQGVAAGRIVIPPFPLLLLTDDAALQLRCAQHNSVRLMYPPSSRPVWTGERWQNNKIRVGYLSDDLRDHAVSYLMAGVFEQHDRERFEIIALSLQPPTTSAFGHRVARAFDLFVDLSAQSDQQNAELLRKMQIDIVVDLVGFTSRHSLGLLAHRPVPVVANYLGFPGTVGTPYADYLIADPYVIPPECQAHYAEKVVYLPDCFQANDDRRLIGEHCPSRAEAGLPKNGFVFCSFNTNTKLNPTMLDVWCRILQQVPESVLWLLADVDSVHTNLVREASIRGTGSDRLVFAARMEYPEHLARLKLADLFLDTLPFNGGTTASDALWAGLPVLTCSGQAYASRMAGSLLQAVGLPELITGNLLAYEQLAVRLASTSGELSALRARLAANRLAAPLFDTTRFCRHLESAYAMMQDRLQLGLDPISFAVPALPPNASPAIRPSAA